jgi:hypothetical protein
MKRVIEAPNEPRRGPCEEPVRTRPAVMPNEAPVPVEIPQPAPIPVEIPQPAPLTPGR